MIDLISTLGDFLANTEPIASHLDGRIYGDTDTPGEGYEPGQGGAVTFKVRGGVLELEEAQMIRASLQFKAYGEETAGADQTYRLLVQSLESKGGPGIKWVYLEQLGIPLLEPDTAWPFVLVFFTIFFERS